MDIINEWKKLGCLTKTIIVVIVLSIIGAISECGGPSVEVAGGVAQLKKTYAPTYTAADIGRDIALDVYGVATNHADVNKIVVSVYLHPSGLLTDHYGHKLPDELLIGSITIDDIDEVRRYASEGAYSLDRKAIFAAQVSQMEYAKYLGM
jgi:hypothetical protein